MRINRDEKIKTIGEHLSTLSNYVTLQNKIGQTDINKSSEKFFIYILNTIYDLNLIDLNSIQDNYPAIDLGDVNSKICIQVTAETTNAKFRNTVEKFFEKELNRKFNKIVFLIISNKEKCSLTDNRIDTVVINTTDLYKEINNLNDNKVNSLESYLNDNLTSRIRPTNSILPNRIMSTHQFTHPSMFIKFMGLDNEPELIDILVSDLKNLSGTLNKLTKNQKEYIYYIMTNGFHPTTYGNREDNGKLYITTSEMNQQFGSAGYEIYESLYTKKLVDIDDEYDPEYSGRSMRIIDLHYWGKLDDTNYLSYIKSFLNSNEEKIRRIILDGDFSILS